MVVALALWRFTASGDGQAAGDPVRVDRSPDALAEGGVGAGRGAGRRAGIFVHVAGAVKRPGLVRVPSGARAAAAVARAGGPTNRADLAGVNLAATLQDGQQVIVPARGVAVPGGGAASAGGAAAGTPGTPGTPKLSLGTATVEQLEELDGIGPTLAHRIVDYRTEHGGFRSHEELREVEGIGEKRFESLSEALQP